MKYYFRTIVKFIDNGEEKKMSFSGQLSEFKALSLVQETYKGVTKLTFFYHDEL